MSAAAAAANPASPPTPSARGWLTVLADCLPCSCVASDSASAQPAEQLSGWALFEELERRREEEENGKKLDAGTDLEQARKRAEAWEAQKQKWIEELRCRGGVSTASRTPTVQKQTSEEATNAKAKRGARAEAGRASAGRTSTRRNGLQADTCRLLEAVGGRVSFSSQAEDSFHRTSWMLTAEDSAETGTTVARGRRYVELLLVARERDEHRDGAKEEPCTSYEQALEREFRKMLARQDTPEASLPVRRQVGPGKVETSADYIPGEVDTSSERQSWQEVGDVPVVPEHEREWLSGVTRYLDAWRDILLADELLVPPERGVEEGVGVGWGEREGGQLTDLEMDHAPPAALLAAFVLDVVRVLMVPEILFLPPSSISKPTPPTVSDAALACLLAATSPTSASAYPTRIRETISAKLLSEIDSLRKLAAYRVLEWRDVIAVSPSGLSEVAKQSQRRCLKECRTASAMSSVLVGETQPALSSASSPSSSKASAVGYNNLPQRTSPTAASFDLNDYRLGERLSDAFGADIKLIEDDRSLLSSANNNKLDEKTEALLDEALVWTVLAAGSLGGEGGGSRVLRLVLPLTASKLYERSCPGTHQLFRLVQGLQRALVNRGEEIGEGACSFAAVGREADQILAVLEKNIYHLLSIGRCELALGAVLAVAVVTREATAAASASGSTGIGGNEDDHGSFAACAKISERFASDAKSGDSQSAPWGKWHPPQMQEKRRVGRQY
eukprot:CAMPEP_0179002196 /NCGR_PEP_ID=MMETSP0795-20121207/11844_1 /TAXON_ID=88552 /ORGANISM="Amoebophrya sp., Strain Ameob2" /LENGTH=729 /DNA_ID=CAMNT_0020695779 /DNA_START=322 /DNA_END=2511 /DNA_ORIENTATION=-